MELFGIPVVESPWIGMRDVAVTVKHHDRMDVLLKAINEGEYSAFSIEMRDGKMIEITVKPPVRPFKG